ncbi:MAG: hypothetical protein Q8O54_12870 [Brevundimonas sp.]|nr:hypothetical protein [Brevundimonas sp.]
MGNLARKIIDAVQNTMLDKLVARLVPLLWISFLWERLSPSESGTASLILIFGVLGLLALHWVLGTIADQPPKPRQRTAYDHVHDHPTSAFAAWDQPPEEGLRPPALIRSLVMTLGVRVPSWFSVIEGLMFICGITLAWMLAYKSEAFWSGVHQALAQQALREQLFLTAAVAVTGLLIRLWAVEQRQRLSSAPPPGLPVLGSTLLGAAFAAFLGMLLSDLFGFGLLPGLIGGPSLLAVALLPPWRTKMLEILFGRREPADGRP